MSMMLYERTFGDAASIFETTQREMPRETIVLIHPQGPLPAGFFPC